MAGNRIESGERLQIEAASQISAGQLITQNDISGIALGDALQGESAVLDTAGVYSLPKKAETWTAGQRVYWDDSSGLLTNIKTPRFAGHSWGSYSALELIASVRLASKNLDVPSSWEIVNSVNFADKFSNISPDKVYYIDGQVDLGDYEIEVPASGLRLISSDFDTSALVSSADNYSMFTSPVGGSGNLLATDLSFRTSGANSRVFDLTSATGFDAAEFNRCNFLGCTSRGRLTNYRQILESGNGFFGGTPELELIGAMNGYRIDTSIVRGISDISALFKAGAGLVFSGRFITDINCDLPAVGALMDFSPANFLNNEALKIDGAFITRQGVVNTSDTTIHPNIDHTSVKSRWSNNVGVPNTTKYIKAVITTEVETVINTVETYEVLEGIATVEAASHFEQVGTGMEFRLLSGNGTYRFTGDVPVDGNPNVLLSIRVTKSSDNGATYSEINHTRRTVNSLVGGRDVAFVPISFISDLKSGDRVRLEIENYDNTTNFTAELDAYFIISE